MINRGEYVIQRKDSLGNILETIDVLDMDESGFRALVIKLLVAGALTASPFSHTASTKDVEPKKATIIITA